MAKHNKRTTIVKTSSNRAVINFNLKAIQEDACQSLLSDMYDEVKKLGSNKRIDSISAFLIGSGITGIITWVASVENIKDVTLDVFRRDNWLYMLLILVGGAIMLTVYLEKKKHQGNEKKTILSKYLSSDKWQIVSQPSSLSLDNSTLVTAVDERE